jgi:hypothetical protein
LNGKILVCVVPSPLNLKETTMRSSYSPQKKEKKKKIALFDFRLGSNPFNISEIPEPTAANHQQQYPTHRLSLIPNFASASDPLCGEVSGPSPAFASSNTKTRQTLSSPPATTPKSSRLNRSRVDQEILLLTLQVLFIAIPGTLILLRICHRSTGHHLTR